MSVDRDSLKLHWFLPTYGDSRLIVGGGHGLPAGTAGGDRDASIGYLSSIARAAEDFGFTAALTPAGAWCEDAWLTTAMVAQETRDLGFLVAFRPGLISPTLAAQMAATFSRHAPGRVLLNVVTGGEPAEQRAYGDHLDKAARYARTDEFLSIVRDLWAGETVTRHGEHIRVDGASLASLPVPTPPVYFGGSSPEAGPVAARHSDVYLTWGEPPAAVATKIDWIRGLAEAQGRTVRFGIRLHVIARDTSEQAWAEASRLLSAIDDETLANVQSGLGRSESTGQAAMRALHERTRADGSWRDPRALECIRACGPVSDSSAEAPEPHWSAPMRRWPISSPSTARWASTSSCCPDTRISRSCTGSERGSSPSSSVGDSSTTAARPSRRCRPATRSCRPDADPVDPTTACQESRHHDRHR